MANRSYLYSLSHRPAAYDDRPESISGLSEWPYDVPFTFRLLMSQDPQLCASLIADGMGDDDACPPMRVHAISSSFAGGFDRLRRFLGIVRLAAGLAGPAPALSALPPPPDADWITRAWRRLTGRTAAPATVAEIAAPVERLYAWLDDTPVFLDAHRNEFLLLETVELDIMSESTEAPLRACVQQEIERCRAAGRAVDALPADPAEAARTLHRAAHTPLPPPFDAFYGLRFDDACDYARSRTTEAPVPLGLQWSDVLYFELYDRASFEACRDKGEAA